MNSYGCELGDDEDPNEYVVITKDKTLLTAVKRVIGVVERVVDEREVYFSCRGKDDGRFRLLTSELGEQILRILKYDVCELMDHFPGACFDPYWGLYTEVLSGGCVHLYVVKTGTKTELYEAVESLNKFVEEMRLAGKARGFKRKVRRFRLAACKRKKSLIRYVDELFDLYSRILVVRVDLGYRIECFGPCGDYSDYIEQVRAERVEFVRWLNSGDLSGVIGYACKLEYGLHAGFHNHLVVFFNGAVHREDITLGRMLGQKWVEIVGEGRGRYFNCNAKSYRDSGVGVVSWNDIEKRKILNERVLSYLCKVDYLLADEKFHGRTFFRGEVSKRIKSRRGRPRMIGC